jgi:hypothetical protein
MCPTFGVRSLSRRLGLIAKGDTMGKRRKITVRTDKTGRFEETRLGGEEGLSVTGGGEDEGVVEGIRGD